MDQTRNLFVSLACVLVGFGVLMVQSASITSWPTEYERIYLSRHVIFLLFGITAAVVCSRLSATFWYRIAPYLFVACVALLAAVLVPGVGTRVNGAQRWLRYGGMSLQPSEIAKIVLPLLIARSMSRRKDGVFRWFTGTVPIIWPIFIIAPLVLIQPDLGTALFLLVGSAIALFIGGWPLRYFILGAASGIPAVWYLVAMKPYQLKRISGFLATWSNFDQAPYQLKQSLVTLGSGGLFGVGLGRGWQKLSFLPEANTDFVFSVVGEELGLLGTIALIVLWIALYVVGLRLLRHHDTRSFEFIAGVTLLTQLVLQAVLNVAVVTAMVPPKGIPHPLISYGGSNLMISLVSLGIVVSLSRGSADDNETRPISTA
jgi:cell division protein FtsW